MAVFKKGDRVERLFDGKGIVITEPIGIGYTVKWDKNGKIERVKDGTLKKVKQMKY